MSRVLGIDPGFASLGFAVLDLAAPKPTFLEMSVLRTEKSSAKRAVFASDDNVRRALEISKSLTEVIERHRIRAVCAESMSFPRNAAAAAKVAMAWGVLAALLYKYDLPIIQASPQEIKKAVSARRDASKEDVQVAVLSAYPEAEALVSDLPKGQLEHAYDAAAAVICSLQSNALKLLK